MRVVHRKAKLMVNPTSRLTVFGWRRRCPPQWGGARGASGGDVNGKANLSATGRSRSGSRPPWPAPRWLELSERGGYRLARTSTSLSLSIKKLEAKFLDSFFEFRQSGARCKEAALKPPELSARACTRLRAYASHACSVFGCCVC